jgi:hypothetical protein
MADRKQELEKLYADARKQRSTRPSDIGSVEKIVTEEIEALEKFKKAPVPSPDQAHAILERELGIRLPRGVVPDPWKEIRETDFDEELDWRRKLLNRIQTDQP